MVGTIPSNLLLLQLRVQGLQVEVWVGPSTSTGVRPGPRSPESVLRTRAGTRYAAPLSTATVEEIRPSQASSTSRLAAERGRGRRGKTRLGRRQSRTAPRRPLPRPQLGKKKRETKKHRLQRFVHSKSEDALLPHPSRWVDEPPRHGARFLGGLQLPGGGRSTAKREERGVKALAREEDEPPTSSPTCGLSGCSTHAVALPATCDISTAGAHGPVAAGGGIHGGRGRHVSWTDTRTPPICRRSRPMPRVRGSGS